MIHELLAVSGGLTPEKERLRHQFAKGLALYRARQWQDAQQAFAEGLAIVPDDGPSRTFVERCARFAKAPPDEAWDGAYELTNK